MTEEPREPLKLSVVRYNMQILKYKNTKDIKTHRNVHIAHAWKYKKQTN